jgi:hypothetical protein
VKESSAHAWVEVYFPGYGWIEFEPTPSQSVVSRDPEEPTAEEPVTEETPEPSPTPADPRDGRPEPTPVAPNSTSQGGSGSGSGAIWPWLVAGTMAMALVGGIFFYRRSMIAGRADVAHYYGRMVHWSRLLRLRPQPHQTPYEFTESLVREVPGAAPFARQITRAYVRGRYARPANALGESSTLRQTWEALRGRIVRSVPRGAVRKVRRRR